MRVLTSLIVGPILFGTAAAAVAAAEVCVTCEGPAASYACSFADPSAVDTDARLKLYCITELAKAGPHTSCTVERTKRAPCGGALKTFAMPDGMAVPSSPVATAPLPQPAAPPTKDPHAANPNTTEMPPKTIKEMVEQGNASTSKALEKTGETAIDAAKTTGTALQNAGKAVGNAAKKTWTCITSLFGDC